jgi:hypothetical protein
MSDPGQVVYSFGPFGTAVCPGPYGIFRWQKTNMTRVEFTDTCLRGRKKRSFFIFGNSSPGGEVMFEIPYVNISLVRRYDHPAKLRVSDVLEFTFVSGEELKVLSIAAYKGPAARALEVLRRYVPGELIQG